MDNSPIVEARKTKKKKKDNLFIAAYPKPVSNHLPDIVYKPV